MKNKCSKCGIELITSAEFERKKGDMASGNMAAFFELSNPQKPMRNAIGVACAVCGETYCAGCMQKYAKRHSASGGLACLKCGGRMTAYER